MKKNKQIQQIKAKFNFQMSKLHKKNDEKLDNNNFNKTKLFKKREFDHNIRNENTRSGEGYSDEKTF